MNKKIQKFISKGLIASILLANVSINSLASTLSEDTRYETFEDNNITINDVLEESKVDVEIGGNTLVNLANHPGSFTVTRTEGQTYRQYNIPLLYPLKANKTYTLYLTIENNEFDHSPFTNIVIGQGDGDTWSYRVWWDRDFGKSKADKGLGRHKVVFTTHSRIEETSHEWIKFIFEEFVEFNTTIKDVVLLEGSHDDEIDMFEGMKSVGQDDIYGHSIEIANNSGNLFDKDSVEHSKLYLPGNSVVGKTSEIANSANLTSFIFKCKKNTTYVFSKNGGITLRVVGAYKKPENKGSGTMLYYENNSSKNNKEDFKCEINSGNYEYLLVVYYNENFTNISTRDYVESTFQINIDTKKTYYPYKNNKKEISLKEPLRNLPNGVKDKIVKRNGQWFIERNCGEILVDGTGYLSIHDNTSSTYIRYRIGLPKNAKNSGSSSTIERAEYRADRTNVINSVAPGAGAASKEGGLYSGSAYIDSNPVCYFSIERTKLNTQDIAGFASWLKQNNIKIVYQLSSPIYEPLNISSSLQLYNGSNYISTDSVIPANIKIVVDRVANRAKEFSEIAQLNPTVENLSIARMWINLMNDSILKDQFNNEIDNIIQVEDLELEKKKVSANLDLYIKSENTLSMSLDTNSVTFNDYSGVEDLEMISAVNIAVNSSLPYSLNAYMPSGFYNSDKSKSLDINTLNIKESTNSKYQQFVNTTDKIVLKDNCSEGNGIYHSIDLKLGSNNAHKADVYKTVVKFEIQQK